MYSHTAPVQMRYGLSVNTAVSRRTHYAIINIPLVCRNVHGSVLSADNSVWRRSLILGFGECGAFAPFNVPYLSEMGSRRESNSGDLTPLTERSNAGKSLTKSSKRRLSHLCGGVGSKSAIDEFLNSFVLCFIFEGFFSIFM